MTMSKWTAIKSGPLFGDRVPSGPFTDKVEWFSSNDEWKFWALFQFQVDGSVVIKTHSGKFEDEYHGAAYTAESAARFKETLLAAGFVMDDKAGDMRNIFN